MKKIKITTPENIDIEYTLADLASRSAASIIDMAFQGILQIILIVSLLIILYFAPDFWEKYYGWLLGTAILIFGLISYGYYIAMELSMNGQTPGKKILKIRTIRRNGEPVTIQHSALRNLFKVFIDMFGIGVFMIFFTKEHRRIGDFAASTIVIIEGNQARPVTLESLQSEKAAVNYYITKEEEEILKSYIERKDRMEDCTKLQKEIKAYFTEKFETAGVLKEFEEFISKI